MTRQELAEETMEYQAAKRIARDGDAAARCALASNADTRPEILYFLAEDPDIEVRRRIAENAETPRQADMLLARDESEAVRCVLAKKIGKLFPEMSATKRNVMRRTVLDLLELLTADQTRHVREIVSDALKSAPDVPPHIVRQLASDPYLTVCGPVLEFSPVLTEEDLVEIISSTPVQGALGAITRRSLIGERVSDAIVATDDTDAIGSLLANPTAQIREETLDGLIDRAPEFEAWHAPLVRRPKLPAKAAQRIAGFVAQSLLDDLRRRTDLEEDVLNAVERAVSQRLQEEAEPETPDNRWVQDATTTKKEETKSPESAKQRVEEMYLQGELDEKIISEAAASGDSDFVIAAIAMCAGKKRDAVDRIFQMRSSKGIIAICWKANLSMNLAVRLQVTIGNIAPGAVLKSAINSDYPLSEGEMNWQLKFFESDF